MRRSVSTGRRRLTVARQPTPGGFAVTVGAGARVLYSILHPGVVVEPGAVVEYAILGEGTVVGAGAHVGAQPDGTDDWCVATVGPDVAVPAGATVPAGAMIYDGAEVHA